MPTANINKIPPNIPGLRFTQTGENQGTVSGSVDALNAAGVPMSKPSYIHSPDRSTSGAKLYPFQSDGVSEILWNLKHYGGAMLADDMGLGKTVQAMVTAHQLLSSDPSTSILIVCPAGVRHQWQAWCAKVTGTTRFANLGPQSNKEYVPEWESWASTNGPKYGAVSYNLMAKALDTRRPTLLILDEPHNFLQSRGSTYNKAIWKHLSLIRYRLALTGTPYLAKPAGLWSILYILLGMRFGKARDFDIRYCNGHQGQWGWDNHGASNMGELSDRLKFYMVRRMKTEVLSQMPKVTRVVRWVEGTKQAASAMAMMDHTINGMTKAQESTLLEKMDEVCDVASECSSPSVIFTWMKEHANQLGDKLAKSKQNAIVIHGDWEAGQRAKMVDQAREHKLTVVTTYGASSTGLDGLQHLSSNWIAHSINPVPAITLQAIDRLNRIGQKEPITATFVAMKNSVDELIVDKVINRLDVFGQILGRDKASLSLQDALRSSGLTSEQEMDAIFESLT